jgi:hypothetical protein
VDMVNKAIREATTKEVTPREATTRAATIQEAIIKEVTKVATINKATKAATTNREATIRPLPPKVNKVMVSSKVPTTNSSSKEVTIKEATTNSNPSRTPHPSRPTPRVAVMVKAPLRGPFLKVQPLGNRIATALPSKHLLHNSLQPPHLLNHLSTTPPPPTMPLETS